MEETLPLFEEVKVGSPSWLREARGALPWHLGLEVGGMEQGQQEYRQGLGKWCLKEG